MIKEEIERSENEKIHSNSIIHDLYGSDSENESTMRAEEEIYLKEMGETKEAVLGAKDNHNAK